MLRFQIGFRQVLAQNAYTEQLNSTQEQDDARQRRPAADRVAVSQRFDNDDRDHQKRSKAKYDTQHGGNRQGRGGKRYDPL